MVMFKKIIVLLSTMMFSISASAVMLQQEQEQVVSVPEPSVLSLILVGVIAIGLSRRKSHR